MKKDNKYSLKELRARNNYTQEDMAEYMKVSRQRYITIENNPSVVACKTMIKIANRLGVDIGDINFFVNKPHKQ